MSIFLNKKILIYGTGRSGLSAFQFLKKKCDAFLYDDFKIASINNLLNNENITFDEIKNKIF